MILSVPIGIVLPLAILVLLLALGVPVVFALAIGNILFIQMTGTLPIAFFGDTLFSSLTKFALIAVPLYVLTGDAVVEAGLSTKLLTFADKLVGGFRTGVGSSTVLGCGLFASISGSNASDAAAIGRITYGELKKYGYPGGYAAALVASGSTTGILIPPSIAYIIIGVALGISASRLFLAALIPGLLILFGVLITNVLINWYRGYEYGHEFGTLPEIGRATWEAKSALAVPVIILGGIYSGIFTPTESAAVAVATIFAIGIYRSSLSAESYYDMYIRSSIVCGIILPIVAMALTLAGIFAALGFPQMIADGITSVSSNSIVIILLIFAVLILAGAVMETTPNILILGPLFLPIIQEIGMDPVHYAVFLNTALGVGFITPPIGINLYVLASVTGEQISDIAYQAVPYVIVLMLITLLIAFYPPISTVFL